MATIQLTPTFVTFFIFVTGYMVASIWWAATLTAAVKGMTEKLERAEREHVKNENRIDAVFRRVDEMKARLEAAT